MEVGVIAAAHEAAGGSFDMVTLTVRHVRADPLRDVFDGLKGAWKSLQQSARWRAFRTRMTGTITATEVTIGLNGWHVHLHVLVLWAPGHLWIDDDRQELRDWGPEAWAERVERRLGRRPDDHGFHLLVGEQVQAKYVAKIAPEVTRSDYKTTDALGLILDGMLDGEAEAFAQWHEWVSVMVGKRAIVFSRGLRETYELEDELSDAEVVDLDRGGEPIGLIARKDHRALNRVTAHAPVPAMVATLETVEATGTAPGVQPWLPPGERGDLPPSTLQKARRRRTDRRDAERVAKRQKAPAAHPGGGT